MMQVQAPPELIEALAKEFARMPDCIFEVTGPQLLQIITFLQLALRHPELQDAQDDGTLFVRAFIADARNGLQGFPVAQGVIDSNEYGSIGATRQ